MGIARIYWEMRAGVLPSRMTKLRLGDLTPTRDWGHARDYADAMVRILSLDEPDDYVLASGETHSVGDFVREAIKAAGLTFSVEDVVETDEAMVRPAEVWTLKGNSQKFLGDVPDWQPTCDFYGLVLDMVSSDIRDLGHKLSLNAASPPPVTG